MLSQLIPPSSLFNTCILSPLRADRSRRRWADSGMWLICQREVNLGWPSADLLTAVRRPLGPNTN